MSEIIAKIFGISGAGGKGALCLKGRKGTKIVKRQDDVVTISEEARRRFASDGDQERSPDCENDSDREGAGDENADPRDWGGPLAEGGEDGGPTEGSEQCG